MRSLGGRTTDVTRQRWHGYGRRSNLLRMSLALRTATAGAQVGSSGKSHKTWRAHAKHKLLHMGSWSRRRHKLLSLSVSSLQPVPVQSLKHLDQQALAAEM